MTAVLLYPGAGTDASHPSLVAIEKAVAPTPCVRADFPYRKLGRRPPTVRPCCWPPCGTSSTPSSASTADRS